MPFILCMASLGEFVKADREARGMSQDEYGPLLGVNGQTISNIETGVTKSMKKKPMRLLSELTGTPIRQLMEMTIPARSPRARFDIPNGNHAIAVELLPIPEWECNVAAGEWVDCHSVAAFDTNSQEYRSILRQGLFRIRIVGDSMEDVWHDGSLVEFKRLYADEGGFAKGEDYYVHRADNTATFKRFVKSDDDCHYFAAINRRKYKADFVVPRQEVAMVGQALHMIVPPKRKR